MKIRIVDMPIARAEDTVFMLSYGQENPVELTLQEAVKLTPESRRLLEELFPERWIVKLYFRIAGRGARLVSFTKGCRTKDELERAMIDGVDVAYPDDEVIKMAIEALSANGSISLVEQKTQP